MSKPVVAIVGRPNVGKSTFFNYIIGQKLSIVEDKPGVTRDRIYADAEWRGRKFTLVDTAGIEPKSEDIILSSMREQVQIAMDIADVIIFLTDIKQGVTETDKDIALLLKKTKKPVVLVCNKADKFEKERSEIYEFYNLGMGDPMAVSAVNASGIGDVLDEVYNNFKEETIKDEEEEYIKVALIGKPNVRKILTNK
jgi:GTP-binding protein